MHFLILVVALFTARLPLMEGKALIQTFLFLSCGNLQEFIYLRWYVPQGIWETQSLMKSGFKALEKQGESNLMILCMRRQKSSSTLGLSIPLIGIGTEQEK